MHSGYFLRISAAGVVTAGVVTAIMLLTMVLMVVAVHVGIEDQSTGCQSLCRRVRAAGHTAV